MKTIIFIGVLVLGLNSINYAQSKKSINLAAIDKWTYVSRPSISPNGKYAAYLKENDPLRGQTLTVLSTGNSWRKAFISKDFHYGNGQFSSDSRSYIFQPSGDSLGILTTENGNTKYLLDVTNFEIIPGGSNKIYYQKTSGSKKNAIYDLTTGKTIFSTDCSSHLSSPDGNQFLYCTIDSISGKQISKVYLLNVNKLSSVEIWNGAEAEGFVFSPDGKSIAFLGKKEGDKSKRLFYYPFNRPNVVELERPATETLQGRYTYSSLVGFTRDGSMLYYKIEDTVKTPQPSKNMAKVDVWNYNDPMLQEEWIERHIHPNDEYLMAANLKNGQSHLLCAAHGIYWDPSNSDFPDDKFLFSKTGGGEINEFYWNKTALESVFLLDTKNGKKLIDKDLSWAMASMYKISPDGKYILYFDQDSKNYYSYRIADGKRINLTKEVDDDWCYDFFKVQIIQEASPKGILGWIKGKDMVLLQGQNDIWRVSLDGKSIPLCITHQYDKNNHLSFRLFTDGGTDKVVFDEKQKVYVSAFDPLTKRNGFYAIYADGKKKPEKLTMADYAYFVPATDHSWGELHPVKASKTDAWIVGRQSATESVNYFYTTDFKNFKPISHNYPEKAYNWVKTELITWTLPDGHTSQGVLYKPENFDSTRKYPLIFLYYEELSNDLNVFMKPERAVCDINIPYYVSNGYLVFTPDIERTSYGAGVDALNTMESAAKYFSGYSYVDDSKLGLCGTSMGGYKTNFIVTHSPLFAAASTTSGPSNISAFALSTWGDAMAIAEVEVAQFYIGHSIVDRPDLYISNSPIFYVKNVQTPLLMLYGEKDPHNYVDGVALFQALRRSGKKAWMLSYDGQGHFLDDNDTIVTTDYTIRQKQFFDHYLKGADEPVWMTRGIPAWRKRIDDGLEMDTKSDLPKTILFTKESPDMKSFNNNNASREP